MEKWILNSPAIVERENIRKLDFLTKKKTGNKKRESKRLEPYPLEASQRI